MRNSFSSRPRGSSGSRSTGKRQKQNAVRRPARRAASQRGGASLRDEISGWLVVVTRAALTFLLVVSVLAATVAILHGAVPVGEIVSAVSATLGHLKAANL